MALWFLRGLLRGVVTTRYPDRSDESATSLPTPPVFRPGVLDRASAIDLAAACPSLALRLDGDALVFDVGACTACGRCWEVAPRAVAPSGMFELAATVRSDLVKRIPLQPEAGT
jgi:dissimilatory sulfite reductase (desulfoviridin) alpha/beta subunit